MHPLHPAPAHPAIALEEQFCAHNYHPLAVVLTRGEGIYAWDDSGKRYMDMMSAYSALSFGHAHARLIAALTEQAQRLALTSRAFYSDQLGPFLKRLCEVTGQDKALPMNTGAEAVETALKAARKWAYKVKGVADGCAEIITCDGNFHGRTTTIVGFSSEPGYRDGFGPFGGGFKLIPYGDAKALAAAITPSTAAFLVEPIQGEAGIIIPPRGYLAECARLCAEHNILLLADEVQTGLGRTGRMLACEHENVHPDGLILGKALGGGLLPVSAFLARREVMNVFAPGDHGSTFGGNPLAARVGLEAIELLLEEKLSERADMLGPYFEAKLRALQSPLVREVRGKGLLIGMDIDPAFGGARAVCERLLDYGILTKDTHDSVVRFAPPLIIEKAELDWAAEQIGRALSELQDAHLRKRA
jgi:ornithine--oxo-acid transaminase